MHDAEYAQLEALEHRLPLQHPMKQKVQADLVNKKAAIKGEKEVNFPLSFLDESKYLIIHNLRLPDRQGHFQIDTLLVTDRFMLLLEVKNWYGTIIFGENGQVTRIGDSEREEGFKNPIPQAKLQRYRLQKRLREQGYSNIPIDFFCSNQLPQYHHSLRSFKKSYP